MKEIFFKVGNTRRAVAICENRLKRWRASLGSAGALSLTSRRGCGHALATLRRSSSFTPGARALC